MHQYNEIVQAWTVAAEIFYELRRAAAAVCISDLSVPITIIIPHIGKRVLIILLFCAIASAVISAARKSEHLERLCIARRVVYDKLIGPFDRAPERTVAYIYFSFVIIICVYSRKMSFLYDPCTHGRRLFNAAAYHEKRCLYIITAQDIKYLRCRFTVRTIFERQIHMSPLTGSHYLVQEVIIPRSRRRYRAPRRFSCSRR